MGPRQEKVTRTRKVEIFMATVRVLSADVFQASSRFAIREPTRMVNCPRNKVSGLVLYENDRSDGGRSERSLEEHLNVSLLNSFDAMTMPAYRRMHTNNRYRIFSNQPRPASQTHRTHQSFRVSSIISNRAHPKAHSHNFFALGCIYMTWISVSENNSWAYARQQLTYRMSVSRG